MNVGIDIDGKRKIVSIFINNFNDYYWNRDNKAIPAGGKIYHIIYENYLNNNGKFIL